MVLQILQEYLAHFEDTATAAGETCSIHNCPIAKALQWKTGEEWNAGVTLVWHRHDPHGMTTWLQAELTHFVQLVDNEYALYGHDTVTVEQAQYFLEQALGEQ